MLNTKLTQKLDSIKANPTSTKDFVICDAKDSDMGFGRAHSGFRRTNDGSAENELRDRSEFIEQIHAVVEQDLIDLMLMSVSIYEQVALRQEIFKTSQIGTAIRANDATDVWGLRWAAYRDTPSLPFETADLDYVSRSEPGKRGIDLGLYSITFNNDATADRHTLERYKSFRKEAEKRGFSHFLEVFNPNVETGITPERLPFFINDCIVRCLGGVHESARPAFLKVVYNGPAAMEELAGYDPYNLVVGVLGGSSGTTHDCLKLVHDAKKYGARIALFGRKIHLAEDPLSIISMMRAVAEGDATPQEAVRAYHGTLRTRGIKPKRELDDDLQVTDPALVH